MISPEGILLKLKKPSQPLIWFPLKVRIFYFILNILIRAVKRRDGTLNRSLLSFLDLKAPPVPIPGPDGVATADHIVDPDRNLSVRHFSPSSPGPLPILVYFHGGGFVSGSATDHVIDRYCRQLSSRLPAHILSVDYRLAPEHRCPAPYDDGVDVLRWLDNTHGLVADLSAVFLVGDSAGGNIAHHVAKRAARETYERVRVVGLVAIQPYFGGEESTVSERRLPFVSREHLEWAWRSFLPEGSTLDHEAAHVFGPRSPRHSGEWTGFPGTMVVVGGLDPLQDRQRWYWQGLRRAGVEACLVEYPNAVHAFQLFQRRAEGEQLITDVRDFVRRRA